MCNVYMQEVNLSFIIFNLFYLRFGTDVFTGNFSFKICGVVPWRGSVRNILLYTHTALSQNFTNNLFLHATRNLHATF
jgi:hypothetical protein